ncbi:MAG: metallophosphoesterase [Peptococcaceae bacterium]
MRSFFFMFMAFIILMNLIWFFISDRWLRRDLTAYPAVRKSTRALLFIWLLLILLPALTPLIPGMDISLTAVPWLWQTLFYLWIGLIFFWMPSMIGLGIPMWLISSLFGRHKAGTSALRTSSPAEKTAAPPGNFPPAPAAETAPLQNAGLSRRQFIHLGLVAAPPVLVSTGTAAAWWNSRNLQVYAQDLPVKDLPPDLEGFTITHISDIHIGTVTGRDRVKKIVEAANALKSSMIAVTGDILDKDLGYLPDLIETLGSLKAPLGSYLCIGNHDKIYNASHFINTVRKAGLNLLLDEALILDTGKTPLKILGIDYTRQEALHGSFIEKAEQSLKTPPAAVKILLAHHPHAFDYAAACGIPITLSGHTHGGQIVLRAGENLEIFNPGNHLFRYVKGIYRAANGSSLFVHQGSGDWFPLRVGSLCEVVQLRLTGDIRES